MKMTEIMEAKTEELEEVRELLLCTIRWSLVMDEFEDIDLAKDEIHEFIEEIDQEIEWRDRNFPRQ